MSWAAELAQEDSAALARVRLVPGVEVLEEGGRTWIRGPEWSPALERRAADLPLVARYELDGEGRLFAPGRRVPVERLPGGDWTALALSLIHI